MNDEKNNFVIYRKSKDLVFHDMDDDLLKNFLVFTNRYARGNKLYALRILLYNAKDSLIHRVEKLEQTMEELLEEPEEEEKTKKKLPKTMGGNNE